MTDQEYEENGEMLENEENDQHEEEQQQEEISYEDYQKLQSELEQLRKWHKKSNEEAKNYRLKAKAYEEVGYSPEELKEIREKEEKRKMRELENKQDFNKLKETLTTQFSEKEKEYQQKIESLQSSMEKTLIQREVTSAIAKNEGIETLLRPHIESNVKLMENDDGTLVPRVMDKDGSPAFNSKGEYMSVDDYVSSLREHEDFGVAFKGRQASGAGTKAAPTEGKRGRTGLESKPRSQWTREDREKFKAHHGENWMEEYEKLPI